MTGSPGGPIPQKWAGWVNAIIETLNAIEARLAALEAKVKTLETSAGVYTGMGGSLIFRTATSPIMQLLSQSAVRWETKKKREEPEPAPEIPDDLQAHAESV